MRRVQGQTDVATMVPETVTMTLLEFRATQNDGAARRRLLAKAADYRTMDLATIARSFDVVYDTAATMTASTGMALLRQGGVFLDLDPKPGKFVKAIFNRRLKLVIGSPRADILEKIASAAHEKRFSIRIGEIVPLSRAIPLITELERGRRLGGKGLVAME